MDATMLLKSLLTIERFLDVDDSVLKQEDYESMKVAELKDLLREQGLRVSGKKADLIARLKGGGGRAPHLDDETLLDAIDDYKKLVQEKGMSPDAAAEYILNHHSTDEGTPVRKDMLIDVMEDMGITTDDPIHPNYTHEKVGMHPEDYSELQMILFDHLPRDLSRFEREKAIDNTTAKELKELGRNEESVKRFFVEHNRQLLRKIEKQQEKENKRLERGGDFYSSYDDEDEFDDDVSDRPISFRALEHLIGDKDPETADEKTNRQQQRLEAMIDSATSHVDEDVRREKIQDLAALAGFNPQAIRAVERLERLQKEKGPNAVVAFSRSYTKPLIELVGKRKYEEIRDNFVDEDYQFTSSGERPQDIRVEGREGDIPPLETMSQKQLLALANANDIDLSYLSEAGRTKENLIARLNQETDSLKPVSTVRAGDATRQGINVDKLLEAYTSANRVAIQNIANYKFPGDENGEAIVQRAINSMLTGGKYDGLSHGDDRTLKAFSFIRELSEILDNHPIHTKHFDEAFNTNEKLKELKEKERDLSVEISNRPELEKRRQGSELREVKRQIEEQEEIGSLIRNQHEGEERIRKRNHGHTCDLCKSGHGSHAHLHPRDDHTLKTYADEDFTRKVMQHFSGQVGRIKQPKMVTEEFGASNFAGLPLIDMPGMQGDPRASGIAAGARGLRGIRRAQYPSDLRIQQDRQNALIRQRKGIQEQLDVLTQELNQATNQQTRIEETLKELKGKEKELSAKVADNPSLAIELTTIRGRIESAEDTELEDGSIKSGKLNQSKRRITDLTETVNNIKEAMRAFDSVNPSIKRLMQQHDAKVGDEATAAFAAYNVGLQRRRDAGEISDEDKPEGLPSTFAPMAKYLKNINPRDMLCSACVHAHEKDPSVNVHTIGEVLDSGRTRCPQGQDQNVLLEQYQSQLSNIDHLHEDESNEDILMDYMRLAHEEDKNEDQMAFEMGNLLDEAEMFQQGQTRPSMRLPHGKIEQAIYSMMVNEGLVEPPRDEDFAHVQRLEGLLETDPETQELRIRPDKLNNVLGMYPHPGVTKRRKKKLLKSLESITKAFDEGQLTAEEFDKRKEKIKLDFQKKHSEPKPSEMKYAMQKLSEDIEKAHLQAQVNLRMPPITGAGSLWPNEHFPINSFYMHMQQNVVGARPPEEQRKFDEVFTKGYHEGNLIPLTDPQTGEIISPEDEEKYVTQVFRELTGRPEALPYEGKRHGEDNFSGLFAGRASNGGNRRDLFRAIRNEYKQRRHHLETWKARRAAHSNYREADPHNPAGGPSKCAVCHGYGTLSAQDINRIIPGDTIAEKQQNFREHIKPHGSRDHLDADDPTNLTRARVNAITKILESSGKKPTNEDINNAAMGTHSLLEHECYACNGLGVCGGCDGTGGDRHNTVTLSPERRNLDDMQNLDIQADQSKINILERMIRNNTASQLAHSEKKKRIAEFGQEMSQISEHNKEDQEYQQQEELEQELEKVKRLQAMSEDEKLQNEIRSIRIQEGINSPVHPEFNTHPRILEARRRVQDENDRDPAMMSRFPNYGYGREQRKDHREHLQNNYTRYEHQLQPGGLDGYIDDKKFNRDERLKSLKDGHKVGSRTGAGCGYTGREPARSLRLLDKLEGKKNNIDNMLQRLQDIVASYDEGNPHDPGLSAGPENAIFNMMQTEIIDPENPDAPPNIQQIPVLHPDISQAVKSDLGEQARKTAYDIIDGKEVLKPENKVRFGKRPEAFLGPEYEDFWRGMLDVFQHGGQFMSPKYGPKGDQQITYDFKPNNLGQVAFDLAAAQNQVEQEEAIYFPNYFWHNHLNALMEGHLSEEEEEEETERVLALIREYHPGWDEELSSNRHEIDVYKRSPSRENQRRGYVMEGIDKVNTQNPFMHNPATWQGTTQWTGSPDPIRHADMAPNEQAQFEEHLGNQFDALNPDGGVLKAVIDAMLYKSRMNHLIDIL